MSKKYFLAIIWALWLGWYPPAISAQVIINEVYPNPNTGEDEWAELWNTGSSQVDLNNWQLWDQLSSPGLAFQFAASTPLAAQAYLIISLHNILNNTGDGLVLKNPAGQVIDTLAYTSSVKGSSWAKNPDNFSDIFESDPTPNLANLTPTPNVTPTPTPTPSQSTLKPILSEIMACPTDSDEWVELANPHDSPLDLAGFKLRDSKNQIFAFTNQEIEPFGFLAIELRNVLNNGGDSVSLISPSNQVLDSFAYSQCDAEQAWASNGQQWTQTEFVTKNSANLFTQTNQVTPTAVLGVLVSETEPTKPSAANQTNNFSYPLSVLKPKLDHEKLPWPTSENVAFGPVPQLERGALSVIIGSLLLLIPGLIYVKNRQSPF